jgi:hypothetical protein
MSALPLKAALRQDLSKVKPGNIIAHNAERAGLATEVLDAVFTSSAGVVQLPVPVTQ